MLKTERMKQVVVAGAKPQLVPVIDTLQRLKALHIEEHTPDDFFTYGDPLPEGEQVAQARLTARGLVKSLGLEEHPPGEKSRLADWREALQVVDRVEAAVDPLVQQREEARTQLREKEQETARYRRLDGLGLRLEELHGYRNLTVLLGTTTSDPRPLVQEELPDHHLAITPEEGGYLVALFVRNTEAEKADSLLAQVGFSPLDPPEGHGSVEGAAGRAITEARRVRERLEELEGQIAAAREEHGPRLVAAEAELAAAAERSNAPLRFATSKHGFVITGYIPAGRLKETEQALQRATSQSLYIEWNDPVLPGHGHGTEGHGESPPEETAHPAGFATEGKEPPSLFAHKHRGTNAFTHMLTLHSWPKYKEIDPTVLMYITFPLFFAVMIGDLGFGILIMAVAWYLKNNYPLGMGGPKVSRMLMLAGLWTTLFGVFVYQEAFGIHFIQYPGTLSWEAILAGAGAWGGYKGAHGLELATVTYNIAGRTLETHYISKLGNVEVLLGISLAIALVHLVLAILIGFYNHWILHGAKHAILGRLSWLLMIIGILALAWGLAGDATTTQGAGGVLLAVSVIMIIAGEGVIGALELPKIISNALSYFRLAAVAMSKAGMALAVNTFAFTAISDTSWAVNGVGGWVILIVGHTIVLALGIIAGGLHSMRLQLVEFFNWFYEGGGRPFQPFGDPRLRG